MPIVGEFDAHESVAENHDDSEIQSVKCMGARGMTQGRGRNSDQITTLHRAESRDVSPAR
jgi:hypothetical protein